MNNKRLAVLKQSMQKRIILNMLISSDEDFIKSQINKWVGEYVS